MNLAERRQADLVQGQNDWDCAQIARILLLRPIADEATFQIARTLNRSRADSPAARMRWWRVYSAFPEIYRESAALVWDRQVTNARKRA